jgi:probable phosphoglycerate mutase
LRHGETDWNLERRIQGRTDTPLNATGRAQAAAMATRLNGLIDSPAGFRFVASPLQRAVETMEAVCAACGVSAGAIVREERLTELNFGVWEGFTWPELNAAGIDPEAEPRAYHDWRPEGGESYADAQARVASWLDELDRPAVVVAHGALSRVLRGVALNLGKAEIVLAPVPQDRFFRLNGSGIEWFDARVAAAL